jgi:hypothetical protein
VGLNSFNCCISFVCGGFGIFVQRSFIILCVSGIYHARGANQRIHSCFLLPSLYVLYMFLCETVVGG